METSDKSAIKFGTTMAMFLYAIGVACLLVGISVTVHTIENGQRINQSYAIPLKWYEHFCQSDDCLPVKGEPEMPSISIQGEGSG
jgi:hypothetical protein